VRTMPRPICKTTVAPAGLVKYKSQHDLMNRAGA
jgi:hypothetical protein